MAEILNPHIDRKNLPDTILQAQLDKALDVLERMTLNEEEREIYEIQLKNLRDGEAMI